MKKIFHIILGCFLIFQQSHSQGTWQSRASFPSGRNRAVAFSIDSFGYVGTGDTGYYAKDFWKYDPSTDTWIEIASMPTLGRLGAMSFAIDGKGYVGGGVNGEEHDDKEFWEYDPQMDTWSRKADLPKWPGSPGNLTSFAIGDKGYCLISFYTDDFWEYSPQTDAWTRKADFPGVGRIEQVGFSIGTKGYIGTGFAGIENGRNTAELGNTIHRKTNGLKKLIFQVSQGIVLLALVLKIPDSLDWEFPLGVCSIVISGNITLKPIPGHKLKTADLLQRMLSQ